MPAARPQNSELSEHACPEGGGSGSSGALRGLDSEHEQQSGAIWFAVWTKGDRVKTRMRRDVDRTGRTGEGNACSILEMTLALAVAVVPGLDYPVKALVFKSQGFRLARVPLCYGSHKSLLR